MPSFMQFLGWMVTTVLLLAAAGMAYIATPLFGNLSLIVRSGSMSPTIEAGDLAVVRPKAEYAQGDIIAFRGENNAELLTTHRVVDVRQGVEGTRYVTAGDANEAPDEILVEPERIVGASFLVLPKLGQVLAFGKTRAGFIGFVAVPTSLVILMELVTLIREFRKKRKVPKLARGEIREAVVPPVSTNTLAIQTKSIKSVHPQLTQARPPVPINPMFVPLVRRPSRTNTSKVLAARPQSVVAGRQDGKTVMRTGTIRGRSGMDGLVRAAVILWLILAAVPSALASYADVEISGGNTFMVAENFDEETPTPTTSAMPSVLPSISPSPTPSISPTPAPTGIADHVVISEVQIDAANANQDFVELYNPTAAAINLAGWDMRVRNSSGTESSLIAISTGTIPAHGFFLWANNQSGYSASIGANASNGNNLSPNTSIALRDTADVIIDQLAWGTGAGSQFGEGTAFTPNPGDSDGLERKALSTSTAATMIGVDALKGNGFDSNDNATDFVLRDTSQPQNASSSIEIL